MNNYLISSSTINQMEETINNICKNKPYEVFDASREDINSLIDELSYNSLFASERIIVVKNANFFTTEKSSVDTDRLELFLKNDNDLVTVIFTTNLKVDERKKITKILKAGEHLIICPVLTVKQICKIIEDKFKKEGYSIGQEELYYIVNACQNNYDLVLNECEKIKLYYGCGTKIKLEDIKNIVSMPLENNNFKFIDAVINHDIKLAFKIYEDLRIQKVEEFILFNLLAREYRYLLLVSTLKRKRVTPFEIAKKLGLQMWQVDKYIEKLRLYNEEELANKLKVLVQLDYKVKSGKLNKHLAMEMFILENV